MLRSNYISRRLRTAEQDFNYCQYCRSTIALCEQRQQQHQQQHRSIRPCRIQPTTLTLVEIWVFATERVNQNVIEQASSPSHIHKSKNWCQHLFNHLPSPSLPVYTGMSSITYLFRVFSTSNASNNNCVGVTQAYWSILPSPENTNNLISRTCVPQQNKFRLKTNRRLSNINNTVTECIIHVDDEDRQANEMSGRPFYNIFTYIKPFLTRSLGSFTPKQWMSVLQAASYCLDLCEQLSRILLC